MPAVEATRAKNPKNIMLPAIILKSEMSTGDTLTPECMPRMPLAMRNAAIKNLIVSNFIDPTFVTDRFMPNMELQTDLRRSVFITFPTGRQVRAIRPINSIKRARRFFARIYGYDFYICHSGTIICLYLTYSINNNDLRSNVQYLAAKTLSLGDIFVNSQYHEEIRKTIFQVWHHGLGKDRPVAHHSI